MISNAFWSMVKALVCLGGAGMCLGVSMVVDFGCLGGSVMCLSVVICGWDAKGLERFSCEVDVGGGWIVFEDGGGGLGAAVNHPI